MAAILENETLPISSLGVTWDLLGWRLSGSSLVLLSQNLRFLCALKSELLAAMPDTFQMWVGFLLLCFCFVLFFEGSIL